MLSKIKAATVPETRSSISHASQASDNEDGENDNDTNNNNNNNNLNNNQQAPSKKTQDELLDIVETSRKRRLSKDSADSLTSFIRWSFGHIEPTLQRLTSDKFHIKAETTTTRDTSSPTTPLEEEEEDMLDEKDEDWSATMDHKHQHREMSGKQLLRQHAKMSGASGLGSSAALLKAANAEQRHLSSSSLLTSEASTRGLKRPRAQQTYSPENQQVSGSRKSSSSYLGNIVDRLHQQQHHQIQQQQQQQQQLQQQLQQSAQHLERTQQHNEAGQEQETGDGTNLSFHLQQFLQQQTSLEDLCSSVGLDDSNQLVLAAAIHRALVDSVQPNPAETKSTASSTGSNSTGGSGSSSSGGSGSATNTTTTTNNNNNLSHINLSQVSDISASGAANLHLIDSHLDHQRRAYNTRAALHGLTSSVKQRQPSAMNMSNRVQQQRHAQAAAALSALASAGSHSLQHIAAASAATPTTTPIVDFTCDTCSSSFDDRHRLMQHQSIHLELKKDWFTETPVDEVMKIFNRRRGEFLCNICNLRFEATFDYDKHNHSVHGQRPYCCQFCGNGTRTFRFWRQYLNHLYDHRYIFSCTIDDCDFTVNRRDSLRFHIFRFHLNCQLPQNQQHQHQQHQQLRAGHNLMLGPNSRDAHNNNNNNKWPSMMDDDEDDTENEMNLAD